MDHHTESQPSHAAVDHGNPAVFKPKWFVLDDANVDLISMGATVIAFMTVLFLHVPWMLAIGALAVFVLPFRHIFPQSEAPTGLVLITGGSSGIGAELAYIFAQKGHDLILVGRDLNQLQAVKRSVQEKYSKAAGTIMLDLSIPGTARQLYDRVTGEGFAVDVLVNNAGLGGTGDTLEQPIELCERMTTLNCITPVQLTQLFGRDMAKRGRGWILQNSSVGWIASPGQNIYHATKHYLRAFSEALSIELRAYPGVINTQLMPGPTHTQWVTRSHAQETFMAAASGAVEDPKAVALAGYNGLCRGKRMVFSSWNAAFTSFFLQLVPRSVHLTIASLMNAPTRGMARMEEPQKDQNARGSELEKKHEN
ncbi:Dehydrogenase/reductase SDR family member 7 [Cladobotryum mycophilum]|uniref:Dehydrogenase/reductase SDR family member 7 n=1 Tax=Cladobotryum mycophilum TaxID=491253 RepID=A0ABR0T0U6_9HYPO